MGWKLWGKTEKEPEQPQVLDPNAVPSGSGGKRANNIPLLLIILVVFIFLAIVAYVAFERSNHRKGRESSSKGKSLRNTDGQ
jgi:flagellar basal body-associated protein FliL